MGKRILENVSAQGWEMWREHSTLLINHYGLNLADPGATKTLADEMEKFFFGEDARVPDEWVPKGEKGTGQVFLVWVVKMLLRRGGLVQGGKGAPQGKGAPGQK
ncbi:MAG: hypothetical protein CM1200mP6_07910 [Anaerolineaceae bacterium]|nr:MAG: hypothetical protein CM1200mP6_07910 [Anaerolineaceae bacterium]